jgi:hypothetical protein
MLRSKLLKNERALLGQRSEAALCLLVMPHTLLKGARSVYDDSPEPPQQKAISNLSRTKQKTRRKILDLNPTAILPHFTS